MSNSAVGNVYQTIIEEVINSSRVDFDESGIEESVLEELRLGWQQKLSQLDVAQFPWDPKPEPQAQPAAPPARAPTHSQAQFSPQLPQPTVPPAVPAQNGIKQEPGLKDDGNVAIKQEPGSQTPVLPPGMGYNGDSKNNVAAARAAQLVQQQYGNRAAGSISAIQQQPAGQPQQQNQGSVPPMQMPANGQPHLPNAQTDGAGDADGADFEGVLLQRNAGGDLSELGRVEIDRMLHDTITANAKSMEGGGLMLPLKEATKHRTAGSSSKRGKAVANHDGGDDDDDVADEDAINSDLDDPDEDRSEDEVDDDGLGHIMLCMYDKVQRVKNKWKCTLKDGVLTVNGKEYVFHKATGEYEW